MRARTALVVLGLALAVALAAAATVAPVSSSASGANGAAGASAPSVDGSSSTSVADSSVAESAEPAKSPIDAADCARASAFPGSEGESNASDDPTGDSTTDDTASDAADSASRGPKSPRIVSLLANPATDGDAGEFVVLSVPRETNVSGWTLTDGHATAALPNQTVSGTVAFSTEPERARTLTAHPVRPLEGRVPLANGGDAVEVRTADGTVDAVGYDRAPESEVWYRSAGESSGAAVAGVDAPVAGAWWPRGATCRPVTTADVDEVTAFVLPDSPGVPLETLASADDRILLGGYTFTDEDVAAELEAAARRGVDVTVLLEASPVGGTPSATVPVLDRLAAAGVTVRVVGGPGARYAHHHAKYAVVDDRAVVTTENWKPAGVGGAASRGWGVVVADDDVADDLATVFAADADGRDVEPWAAYRRDATFVDDGAATGEFPARTGSTTVPADEVEVLVAPDNAEDRMRTLLADADEEILVQQVRIGGRNDPMLAATLEAARRGVEVRILLDDSWYVREENEALARWLERRADAEGLPLEVRLVDPDGFEKVHVKGVVIDRETAVVGSANWNAASFRENREVLLVVHGEAAAGYYAEVFAADWAGERHRLPAGLVVVVVAALAAAALAGWRRLEFDVAGGREGNGKREK